MLYPITTVLNVNLVITVIPNIMFAHEIVKTMSSSTVYVESCNNTRYHNFQTIRCFLRLCKTMFRALTKTIFTTNNSCFIPALLNTSHTLHQRTEVAL